MWSGTEPPVALESVRRARKAVALSFFPTFPCADRRQARGVAPRHKHRRGDAVLSSSCVKVLREHARNPMMPCSIRTWHWLLASSRQRNNVAHLYIVSSLYQAFCHRHLHLTRRCRGWFMLFPSHLRSLPGSRTSVTEASHIS